jgi:hypothetical protein
VTAAIKGAETVVSVEFEPRGTGTVIHLNQPDTCAKGLASAPQFR